MADVHGATGRIGATRPRLDSSSTTTASATPPTSQALNAIAAAEAETGSQTPRRPGITHLQLVTPTDFVRFAQLKVTAVPQPYWAVKDDYYTYLQLPYLGKWRPTASTR